MLVHAVLSAYQVVILHDTLGNTHIHTNYSQCIEGFCSFLF